MNCHRHPQLAQRISHFDKDLHLIYMSQSTAMNMVNYEFATDLSGIYDQNSYSRGHSLIKPINSSMKLAIYKILCRVAREGSYNLRYVRIPAALLGAAIDLDEKSFSSKKLANDALFVMLIENGLRLMSCDDDCDKYTYDLQDLTISNEIIMNNPEMEYTVDRLIELIIDSPCNVSDDVFKVISPEQATLARHILCTHPR